MTYEPPTTPPAGWYPDPYRPGSDRYWNGSDWVEQWRPSPGGAPPMAPGATNPNGLPDIGDWIGRAFNRAISRWRSAAIVALITSAVPTLLFYGAVAYLLDDVIITTDGDVVGWSNDRLPLAIALGIVAIVLGIAGIFAMQALMLRTVDEDEAEARGQPTPIIGEPATPVTRAFDAIGASVRAVPRGIGWFLLLALGMLAAGVVFVLLAITVAPLAILGILAFVPVAIWLAIRWSFAGVAIVDGPGNPFRRSGEVVGGRWWAVFGRLLLIGIILGVITGAVNTTTSLSTGGDAFGNQTVVELDADGDLIDDFVVADVVPSSPLPIIITVIGQVLVNIISAVGLAAMSELYRTRHRATAPT